MAWHPGDIIVIQEIWNGRLWSARPVIVVEHSERQLVHWCPRGTVWRVPTTPAHRTASNNRGMRFAESLERGDWELRDFKWRLPSLEFVAPGERFAVRVTWGPESNEFWGWYVNIQEPFRETPQGIQIMDLMLDLVIREDHTWLWKDEDEVELFLKRGLFDVDSVAESRAAGHRALELHESRLGPFEDRWADWRPPRDWGVPRLPDGWEEVG